MTRQTLTLAGAPRFASTSAPRVRDGLFDGLTPIERAMAEKLLSRLRSSAPERQHLRQPGVVITGRPDDVMPPSARWGS